MSFLLVRKRRGGHNIIKVGTLVKYLAIVTNQRSYACVVKQQAAYYYYNETRDIRRVWDPLSVPDSYARGHLCTLYYKLLYSLLLKSDHEAIWRRSPRCAKSQYILHLTWICHPNTMINNLLLKTYLSIHWSSKPLLKDREHIHPNIFEASAKPTCEWNIYNIKAIIWNWYIVI